MNDILDLTFPAVTRESCYVGLRDLTLPHQLQINWRPKGQTYLIARCNCGAEMLTYRPESDQAVRVKTLYAEHVESLL